ncbi:MAG: NUDIX domain-containing protein [Spirochaetaceae bacterium]|nr:NUDIX domain-containing protein [Spirochaetaceae bacterium]
MKESMPRSIAGIACRNGKVLVAKRKEGGAIGLRWEFPGGKVEEGESDMAALKREFQEEFGIEISPKRIIGTSCFASHSGQRMLAAWELDIPEGCVLELREHTQIDWIEAAKLHRIDLAESDKTLLPLILSYFAIP